MKTSNDIDKLAAALADAQAQFKPIERTRTVKVKMKSGGEYSFEYAPLDTILSATMPALAKHGLSVAWSPETKYTDDFAEVSQTCRLTHASGQWQEATVTLRTNEVAPQGMGSVLTYGRRYSFEHVVGVVSETDDDGNAASGNESTGTARPGRPSLPPCPECGKQDSVIVGKEEYGGGLVCFGKKGGCGHKWHPPTEADTAAKSETERLLAEGKLTTGDKVPAKGKGKPVYEASLEKLANIADVPTAVKASEFWKTAYIGKTLTQVHYDDLCLQLGQRLADICEFERDFVDADKLLTRFIGEMRIPDNVGTDLRIKLADAKDAKLGVTA